MRRIFPALAVVLAYVMAPGAGEFTENALHLAMTGHTAHAVGEKDHEPRGDEHGCSGPFHVCPCHGTSAFVVDEAPIEVQGAGPAPEIIASTIVGLESDGAPRGIFRPPIG